MLLPEFIFSQLVLKQILISFSYIHVQRINIFMHGIMIIYLLFYYLNIGYFGIFLVISVNHLIFRHCIISTVSHSFWQL